MTEEKHSLTAKTMAGLEPVLAEELKAIGAEDIQVANRAVMFKGDNKVMYKANYWPYTALRILKVIKTFDVKDEEDLYNKIREVKWYKLMHVDGTLSVDTFLHSSSMTHTRYVSQKVKDAIADQFREMFNQRPSVDTADPQMRINLHVNNNHCTLSLDSSGDSLHKRGYRQASGKAPINEVLAAGMLKLAGYHHQINLLDPMCGSGTIPLEAAMMATNFPAGYYREKYGFMNWLDFQALTWRDIIKETFSYQRDPEGLIHGYDMNQASLNNALENARFAKLHHDILLEKKEFSKTTKPFDRGMIIMNPPYGERMKKEHLNNFYKMIGDTLKQQYTNYDAWIITSDLEAIKHVGLKSAQKMVLYNGSLECRFVKYEIYEGDGK